MKRIVWVSCILLMVVISSGCSRGVKPRSGYNMQLDGFEYPFEVHTFAFSSQGQSVHMAYMDEGDKTAPVVVLLHGKNFSGYYWKRVAGDLLARGYRVVIPDQVGFGKSSKPLAYQFSFAQLGFNTHCLLDSLGVHRFTVVGHSMGGMLATHMAATYNGIEKLVLINPIGLEDYLQYVEYQDPDFFYQKELGKTLDAARAYQKKNYYDGQWNNSYEALLEPFAGWKSGPDYERVAWNAALTYGPIFTEEIVSKLNTIATETHLIVGTRDRTGPGRGWKKKGVTHQLGRYDKLGKQIADSNANITLYELTGLGHMPFYEDYAAFSKPFFTIFSQQEQ